MPDGDLGTSVFVKDSVVCKRIDCKMSRTRNVKQINQKIPTTMAAPGGNSKNRLFRCKIFSNRRALDMIVVRFSARQWHAITTINSDAISKHMRFIFIIAIQFTCSARYETNSKLATRSHVRWRIFILIADDAISFRFPFLRADKIHKKLTHFDRCQMAKKLPINICLACIAPTSV